MTQGTAVIIGVGPGLGLALARAFGTEGHNIALLARSTDKLDDYTEQLAPTGVTVRGYAADAGDPASLRKALATAFAQLGAPDVLVYNAAVLRADTPTDGDDEGWANALAVDVLGAKVAAETVLPALPDGRGSLLFTGGGLALAPSPEFASVSVGKAALRAYAAALHAQQQGTDVHVTSVTIAGNIGGGEARFDPDAIARTYLDLHRQAKTEWADELVLY
jgi:short-subunit dehydrogenase